MMEKNRTLVRVELHMHTRKSRDSLIRIERISDYCDKMGIDRIAITDHNLIDGALEAREYTPEKVIVGEEIQTTRGELLGYFMTEWVPPNLAPMEVIERLKAQNAFISVPHPFDSTRKPWEEPELLKILPFLDAIETFNARCLSKTPNDLAGQFAKRHHLLETVGSDAHCLCEIGQATLELPNFDGPDSFRKALLLAEQHVQLSPVFVHLLSQYAVLKKPIAAMFDKLFPTRRS
jgi:hypothetical protein